LSTAKHKIHLENQLIPIVKEYKYLGLPHTKNGIDWPGYCKLITDKISNFLKYLHFKKKLWNYQARIIIYKTFIRPLGEYCLPMITNWIKLDIKIRQKYYDLLEKAHNDSLQWIFDTNRPKFVLELISGLSFERRIAQLEGSLSRHLQALDMSNPLRRHYQTNFLSTGNNYILGRCFNNVKYEKWKKLKRDDSVEMTWETSCKRDWLKKIQQSNGLLQHYILPSAASFSIKDTLTTKKISDSEVMLKWRCNKSFTRSKCPRCLQLFNRAHLKRCSLYSLIDNQYVEMLNNESFLADEEKIKKDLKKNQKTQQINYTLLDYYLNHQEYSQFLSLYNSLWSLIYQK
jgi:hypothetical protein